jgi:hypothetical protein
VRGPVDVRGDRAVALRCPGALRVTALPAGLRAGLRGAAGTGAVLLLFVPLMTLTPAGASEAAPGVYARLEELKTRGAIPLWLGVDRPLVPAEVTRVLSRNGSGEVAKLLEGLRDALGASLWASWPYGPLGISAGSGGLSGGGSGLWWTVGWQSWPGRSELGFAALSFPVGTVDVVVGRAPVQWGPGAYAGLAFSQYAGGLDLLRVSFQPWEGVRYSKFFGRVDDRVSAVGQRVDFLLGPNLRVGVGDAVLMVGSPYWLYLVNPLPPLNALDVGFAIFNKEVHRTRNDNGAITLDFDWVPFPGLRFYGEVLVDDVQFVWPTLISPELAPARWGAVLGFPLAGGLSGLGGAVRVHRGAQLDLRRGGRLHPLDGQRPAPGAPRGQRLRPVAPAACPLGPGGPGAVGLLPAQGGRPHRPVLVQPRGSEGCVVPHGGGGALGAGRCRTRRPLRGVDLQAWVRGSATGPTRTTCRERRAWTGE